MLIPQSAFYTDEALLMPGLGQTSYLNTDNKLNVMVFFLLGMVAKLSSAFDHAATACKHRHAIC